MEATTESRIKHLTLCIRVIDKKVGSSKGKVRRYQAAIEKMESLQVDEADRQRDWLDTKSKHVAELERLEAE